MRRWAVLLVVTVSALLAVAMPPASADPAAHVTGTFAFVDGNGQTQTFAVDVQAAGPPSYAGTGSVQWVTGLHPGLYADIVKVDVDTTSQPGTTVIGIVFTIAGEEWALQVTQPTGGTAHAKVFHLTAFPALVAEGDVSSGGLQVEPTPPPPVVEPTVTSYTPLVVAPGGTVTFAGTCGSRPAPQAFTVNLMNVGNQGFYAGQSSTSFTFPPGTNTGADTPFSGSFAVAPAASGYTLWFVVTCYWPAADYVDNTQGNGWFAASAAIHSVYVSPKVVKAKWWSTVGLLTHGGLGHVAGPTALQVLAFTGGSGPPASTTTTTTTAPRPRPTVAPSTAPPPTEAPTAPPTTTTTVCRLPSGAPC